jgi:hypothetical protein
MRLKSITYRQFQGTPKEWALDEMSLQPVNLIVGRNASGKTRTLNVISNLAGMISGRLKELTVSGNYHLHFDHKNEHWEYALHFEDRKVVLEQLIRGGKALLMRGPGGFGELFSEQEKKNTKFQTPDANLAVFARQDSVQHSYLQILTEWANATFHYPFGMQMGQYNLVVVQPMAPPPDPHDANQTVGVFRLGEKELGQPFKDEICRDMAEIGYEISEIGLKAPEAIFVQGLIPGFPGMVCIYVKEAMLREPTEQFEISQGMFRALSIIIHANYGILAKKSGCILVDDIGEGLDYERSSALIRILIKKVQQSETQILMTSNDRFVMNAVPLEYWTILNREGSIVHVYNKNNSADKFADFKFTGLSNFDFFATDFIKTEADASP